MPTSVNKLKQPIPGCTGETLYDLNHFMTDAQLAAELAKCEYCEEKPCMAACPCDCSPMDFIRAAKVNEPSDIMRSAALIMSKNPLGGICGQTCPDKHCMAACVHKKFDSAVDIPRVQATIVQKAKQLGVMPVMKPAQPNGKRVAIIGGGPTGLAAAAYLSQIGYAVTIYERDAVCGGMCNLIPDYRLDKDVLASDVAWTLNLNHIQVRLNTTVSNPESLLHEGYHAVIVAAGLWKPITPRIPNEDKAILGIPFLKNPGDYRIAGNVAVIGGGATAFDCGITALQHGAQRVEFFALENLSEMPLTSREMSELVKSGIDVNGRTQVTAIHTQNDSISGISLQKIHLKTGCKFSLAAIEPIPNSSYSRNDIHTVIIAIGARYDGPKVSNPAIFYAGDCVEGPSTVVEASAAGKNAGKAVDCYLTNQPVPSFPRNDNGFVKSHLLIQGYNFRPVSLESDFFGRPIESPFFLSAAPPSDGFEQMKRAFEAGWAGGIMKTSFDNVPIHIPAEYMVSFGAKTFGNCDNVSGHQLDRVCREIEALIKLYPGRVVMASTGGPVTGNDAADCRGWQSNTKKLEAAGVMGIEYSLSCPQGGDGTEGDIVSQNADLTVKIIDWILSVGDPGIPKIFKLTGAVTSIAAIIQPIRQVFDRHPGKKAGVTLANTFPTLAFRKSATREVWEEGVVVGMSGEGVLPISYLTLAKAFPYGVEISGNGGPMDYKQAADFLALGCRTVQFCTMVTKYGYSIFEDLAAGVSHLMAARGITSMKRLIGRALPEPITDFMALTPVKKISTVDKDLCVHCGNCKRCPYLAISFDQDNFPVTDASKCIGCSMCNYLCFTKALSMRERTPDEQTALKED